MEHTSSVIDVVTAVTTLLLIAATVLALSKRMQLPFTVLLVVVGIAIAELSALAPSTLGALTQFDLSPELILFVFLPTLIFESSLHLDARQLRRNLLPVLTMAVPGLLICTVIIASMVSFLTPIDFTAALVLGAILSATDPVAVISLFKQLGAPKRLTILVEGESLFNDATAIVASQILLAVAVAGYVSTQTIIGGVGDFFFVFLGGALVGWALAVATGFLLGRAENDPLIEISLTTVLAYFSFLIAEHVLHVSGVMATVAAALTIGSWGKSKISSSVMGYLENFWTYLAFVANALIFLLVGLQIDLAALGSAWSMLIWVILAMLIGRAVVVFGLVPLVTRLPGAEAISTKFQAVMYWGGLRGAIALALALSLGDFEYADTFIVLVTGAVLFTLIVPGLTVEWLIKRLGLDQPPLADRIARAEARVHSTQEMIHALPNLQRDSTFSARTATALRTEYQLALDDMEHQFDAQRAAELNQTSEYNLLLLKCYAVQKAFYYDKLANGDLSDQTYRNLVYALNVEGDSLRHNGELPRVPPRSQWGRWVRNTWMRIVQRLTVFDDYAESIRANATAQDYEYAWAGYHGCVRVLASIDALSAQSSTHTEIANEVRALFNRWAQGARRKLEWVAQEFPEFYNANEQRLARRAMLNSQKHFIAAQRREGAVPSGVATELMEELDSDLRGLKSYDASPLTVDPVEVLKRTPAFSDTPEDELGKLCSYMRQRTIPARQDLVREGQKANRLFLLARGTMRLVRIENGEEVEVGRLTAGDFVDPECLEKRNAYDATFRALTPCAVYELSPKELAKLRAECPNAAQALDRLLNPTVQPG